MKRYNEIILNALIDKYEGSALYMGQNQRQQSFAFHVNEKSLPDYFDVTSAKYETIHNQLFDFEERGFLNLVWRNKRVGHILEKCILNLENIDEIYWYLNRKPKRDAEAQILQICDELKGRHGLIDDFLEWMSGRIKAGEAVKRYIDITAPNQLRELVDLLSEILTNEDEILWREFSVRHYKDSKLAEKRLVSAAKIIADFSEDKYLGAEPEEILQEFGIYKNPSWIMLKGCGRFCLGDPCFDLKAFSAGIGISSTDILSLVWDKALAPQRVVTIENLTSFHRFFEEESLAIYLGGYSNHIKCDFLKGLHSIFGAASFEHFGDIDCGGFNIWKNLCLRTGIAFRPRFMDRDTYLQFLDYGRPLSANDVRQLKKMCEDEFFAEQWELFELMQERGRKLEQECVETEKF